MVGMVALLLLHSSKQISNMNMSFRTLHPVIQKVINNYLYDHMNSGVQLHPTISEQFCPHTCWTPGTVWIPTQAFM